MTSPPDVTPTTSVVVATAVLARDTARTERVLASVAGQPSEAVFVVGGGAAMQRLAAAAGARWQRSVVEVVGELDASTTHLWMVHDDVVPRPGALAALVDEADRLEASLAGSKVLHADRPETLESVGGATDVYGSPHTGLQVGELDQEQYDVVRDVAFIPGESVLVRRDLLRGLGGPDPLMAPVAQGIDLAQRARSAGGRVIVVPSSEVLHEGACAEGVRPWREQAGQLRAVAKVYSPLSLLWVLPFGLVIALVGALARTAMGKPAALLDVAKIAAWNVKNAGSLVRARRQATAVRQVGDEELFRYQMRGSLELAKLGEEVTEWVRVRSAPDGVVGGWIERRRGFWQEPAFVAALAALVLLAMAARAIWLDALPATGYALPAGDPGATIAAAAGGWNPAGLGSPEPLRPAAIAVAIVAWLLAGHGGLATTVLTLGAVAGAFLGTLSLLRTLGLGDAARIIGAAAAAFGPVPHAVAEVGFWPALVAGGAAPWALYLALSPWPGTLRRRIGRLGAGVVATGLVTAFVPLGGAVLAVTAVLLASFVRKVGWAGAGRMAGLAATSALFLFPWAAWVSAERILTGGDALFWEATWWTVLPVVVAVLLAIPTSPNRTAPLLGIGGVVALAGAWLARSVEAGTGIEPTAAGFVALAVGVSVAVAGAVEGWRASGRRRWPVRLVATTAAVLAVAAVVLPLASTVFDGRLGFGVDRFGEPMEFTAARAGAHGADRVLYIGGPLPGETRNLDGVPYRVASAPVTFEEAWLPAPRAGDADLETTLRELTDPESLRPGRALAAFGIQWVVSIGDNPLEEAFVAKLDMRRLPLGDTTYTVFENLESSPRAVRDDGVIWGRDGFGYAGPASSGRVRLAEQHDERWGPDSSPDGWATTISAAGGASEIAADPRQRTYALASAALLVVAVCAALVGVGGRR